MMVRVRGEQEFEVRGGVELAMMQLTICLPA